MRSPTLSLSFALALALFAACSDDAASDPAPSSSAAGAPGAAGSPSAGGPGSPAQAGQAAAPAPASSEQGGAAGAGGAVAMPDEEDGSKPLAAPVKGVFNPAQLSCYMPDTGERTSRGTEGSFCAWSSIAGCTAEGRSFAADSSCDVVLTQRPYWPGDPSGFETPQDDPRRTDAAYQTELSWVKGQVEACGCVCCHSSRLAPDGKVSGWNIDAPGIWTDTFYPTGLALAAGWVDSSALGAYPASDNNGFSRDVSGLPSTDAQRMVAFFEGELARRGKGKADFVETPPFGGPIATQATYAPFDCRSEEGVVGSTMSWKGGKARYVYVLEEGSKNPGVPPNFDTPEGTLWRFDVKPDSEGVGDGITYGVTPPGAVQRVPAEGPPRALEAGKKYYIYVLADVGWPITRCNFTYAP